MIGTLAARNNLRVKNARQQRFQIPKISNYKVPKNVCTFGEVSLIKWSWSLLFYYNNMHEKIKRSWLAENECILM